MTKKKFYPDANQNLDFAKMEEDILKFWQEQKIFEKSVEMRNFANELDEDNTSPVVNPCSLKEHKNCRHEKIEKNEFVFYDGPPFANGLPHYGHLLTGFIKDLVARYQTMKGKKVERRFGWDTHGLPVEMETEKELTKREGKPISGQIAIQEFGIEKFNDACQKSVMKYADDWENYVTRQGRFVDFKNSYKTMDLNYMESVLWAFKELHNKGLLYEDFRVVPYSWACQTPLSNFETRMDNAYRQKASKAITVKFELEHPIERPVELKIKSRDTSSRPSEHIPEFIDFIKNFGYNRFDNNKNIKIYILAWTTTPWTLPSNLALAINQEIDYILVKKNSENQYNEFYILAESLLKNYEKDFGVIEKITTFKGKELLGLKYKPLFPYLEKDLPKYLDKNELKTVKNNYAYEILNLKRDNKTGGERCSTFKAFKILHGNFVSTEDGTGVVHIAPGFGEDDQLLCKTNGIPTFCPVDEGGKFTNEIFDIKFTKDNSIYASKNQEPNFNQKINEEVLTPSPFQGEGWGEGQNLAHLTKNLRNNDTDPENKLWQAIRNRQINKQKFRRQHQIDNYIVDFVCIEKKLIIELDGSQHGLKDNIEYDKLRTKNLEKKGFKVLRFWNNEIYENFNGVCEKIWLCLQSDPHPTLSLEGRGDNYSISQKQEEASNQEFEILSLKNRQVFETNDDIIRYLKTKNNWIKTEQILHNYPHCWRTDTPLIYKAVSSWYVKVTAFKDRMVELNQQINWIPNNIKDGQFGKWLEGARDWSITRNRFWGCPVPVWKSKSGKLKVFGSIAELEKISGKKIDNLHRPFIDEIVFFEDGEEFRRVSDVLDCWFESGSMPYAQIHYPFENKEWFEDNFPADFITEYVAQTRGWFYTLMVLSIALFDRAPFKNVICHGTILDENSQKLSKRLRNYADPLEIFSTIGSDAMRFYMISQPVMRGQELRIDKEGKAIRDSLRLSIKPLINAYNFFCLYANADGIFANRIEEKKDFKNILDRYILAKLKSSVTAIDVAMQQYDTVQACDEFNKFFEVLNNWYIRRNRQRFWKSEIDEDKQNAYDVLYTILVTMCEASAPLLPFTSEFVWSGLKSVKK